MPFNTKRRSSGLHENQESGSLPYVSDACDIPAGMIIFLNSIAIGIETENSIENEWLPTWPGKAG